MVETTVLSIKISNQNIINLIRKNEPFLISRLGWAIGFVTRADVQNQTINNLFIKQMQSHDGIYCNSMNEVKIFTKIYLKAIENSDYLAAFPKMGHDFSLLQNFFIQRFNLTSLHNRILEPFYCILENEKPWTQSLKGKKVLIINPFVDSMQKQLDAGFQIFKHEKLFCEGQEFLFYKSFNCLAGNRPHDNWLKTFHIMCQDIEKLDFDIALLGCGGYGLPLCNFIKTKLKKSAIYIGGGLQLMFGVMGKRWENNEMWKKIIRENNCKFIRPSGDEIIGGKNKVEGGCYW